MMDGEMNRHGGSWQDGKTRAEEREDDITDAAYDALSAAAFYRLCPGCDLFVENHYVPKMAHARSCEELRGQVTP